MASSMTAFVRHQLQGNWGQAVFEIRSLNHRHLDLHFHLPESCQALEPSFREIVKELCKRGKIECQLQNLDVKSDSELSVNQTLVRQLQKRIKSLTDEFKSNVSIDLVRLLQWPGVVKPNNHLADEVYSDLIAGFKQAVIALVGAREREGSQLAQIILERLTDIGSVMEKIRRRLPNVQQEWRNKLTAQFKQAQLDMAVDRFEQEIVYYLQRQDIAEELDRLRVHVNEIKRIMVQADAIGRRLDFFMQELNREANTVASKSSDAVITQLAVELKVLIEQIREQVQNIE